MPSILKPKPNQIPQVPRRGTSILQHPAPGTPAAKPSPLTIGQNQENFSKELHPLPPVHLDPSEVTPERLAKTFLDTYENTRRATLSNRQDPSSSPSYVRGVAFENSGTTAAVVTRVIRHGLGRPHTGLDACRTQLSQVPTDATQAPSHPWEIPNQNGEDPGLYATVQTVVPPGMTITHDLKLFGD